MWSTLYMTAVVVLLLILVVTLNSEMPDSQLNEWNKEIVEANRRDELVKFVVLFWGSHVQIK